MEVNSRKWNEIKKLKQAKKEKKCKKEERRNLRLIRKKVEKRRKGGTKN